MKLLGAGPTRLLCRVRAGRAQRGFLLGVGERERFWGGLLPGPVLGDRQELGRVGVEGRGRGAGRGAAHRGGEQRGAGDGDRRWENADFLVGGFLSGSFKFSDFVHGHVFEEKGKRKDRVKNAQFLGRGTPGFVPMLACVWRVPQAGLAPGPQPGHGTPRQPPGTRAAARGPQHPQATPTLCLLLEDPQKPSIGASLHYKPTLSLKL